MDEDQEMAELDEWLAILRDSKDDDFHAQVRPYFDSTHEMNVIEYTGGRDEIEYQVRKRYKGRHRA